MVRETLPGGRSYDTVELGRSSEDNFAPITVPAGHVWLMGDNRDDSADEEILRLFDLARRIAKIAGRDIVLGPSAVLEGSTQRRCPDISKLAALGYRPRVALDEGLPPTVKWYWDHASMAPAA